jgi:hypothetical protein
MTQIPGAPKGFSEYYQQYLQLLTPQSTGVSFPEFSRVPEQKMSGFQKAIDFISRPLYAATNMADKALDLPGAFEEAERLRSLGQSDEAASTTIKALGNFAVSGATGLFAQSKDNKNLWSDIIEKTADVNNRNNPNYVDIENNANPQLKGFLGFIGDVALDPINAIPGALIAKGVVGVGRAAGAIGKAVKRTVVGPKVADDVPDVKTSEGMRQGVQDVVDESVRRPAQATDRLAETIVTESKMTPGLAATSAFREILDSKKFTKPGTARSLYLAGQVSKELGKLINRQIDVVDNTPVFSEFLNYDQWLPEFLGLPDDVKKTITISPDIKTVGRSKIKESNLYELEKAYDRANEAGTITDNVTQKLANEFFRYYDDYSVAYQQAPRATTILGNVSGGARETQNAIAGVNRILTMAKNEENNLAAIISKPLFNSLKKMSPEELASFVDKSQQALAKNGIVEDVLGDVTKNTAEWNLLQLFDINLPTYRRAREDLAERINRVRAGVKPQNTATAAKSIEDDADFVQYFNTSIGTSLPGFQEDALKIMSSAVFDFLNKNFNKSFLDKFYAGIRSGVYYTAEEVGAGVTKVENLAGTYAQFRDLEASVSKQVARLLMGSVKRGPDGKPIKTDKNKFVYEELPNYVKPGTQADAYLGFQLVDKKAIATTKIMEAAEAFLTSKGIPLVLDYKNLAVRGSARIIKHGSFTDVYNLMARGLEAIARKNNVAPDAIGYYLKALNMTLFHTSDTAILSEKLGDAFVRAVQGADRDEILSILKSNLDRSGKKELYNWFATTTPQTFGFIRGGARTSKEIDFISYKPSDKGNYLLWDPVKMAGVFADAIIEMRPAINDLMSVRREAFTARLVTESSTVSPEIARNLLRDIDSPAAAASEIKKINDAHKMVQDYVRAIDGAEPTQIIVEGSVVNAVPKGNKEYARASERVAQAQGRGDKALREANEKNAEDFRKMEKEINQGERELVEEALYSGKADPEGFTVYDTAYVKDADGYSSMTLGMEFFNRAFRPFYRLDPADGINLASDRQSLAFLPRKFLAVVTRELNELFDTFRGTVDSNVTDIQQAFKLIQLGESAPARSSVEAARKALLGQIGRVYDVTGDLTNTILGSGLSRTGATLTQIARTLENKAVLGRTRDGAPILPASGQLIDVDLAVREASKYMDAARKVTKSTDEAVVRKTAETMAALDQWKTWPVEDIKTFVAQSQAAVFELNSKVLFINQTYVRLKELGLGTTNAAKARANGFVRVTSGKGSYFEGLMPDNLYVPTEVAEQLSYLDTAMSASRRLTSPMGKFVEDFADPLFDLWKKTVTIFRPGHHARNELGGQSFRFTVLGGDGFVSSELKAYRLLAPRKNYTSVDMLKTIKDEGLNVFDDAEVIVSGKNFSVTANEAFQVLEGQLFDVGKTVEDFLSAESKVGSAGVARVGQTVLTLGVGGPGSFVEKKALQLSEFVEHKARAAHFIQALHQLSKGKGVAVGFRVVKAKNKEDAIRIAVESTIRTHPNAANLAAFESKYMRRLIPFYSWYKPALVALVQSAVLNPGRTLTFIPKANYNLAMAMGVNPDSIYNPFPEDQLFPSFLTEEAVGPHFEFDGKYVSINPGFVSQDVFGSLSGGLVEGGIQMMNPYLRVPLELLAGSRLGTQAPIRDFSDYIDSTIPGVNYISNISGRSVTGGFEEQDSVARGSKTGFDQTLSAINWLSGLGLRNYSRSSFVNYAEIERRNEVNKQQQSFVDQLFGG